MGLTGRAEAKMIHDVAEAIGNAKARPGRAYSDDSERVLLYRWAEQGSRPDCDQLIVTFTESVVVPPALSVTVNTMTASPATCPTTGRR